MSVPILISTLYSLCIQLYSIYCDTQEQLATSDTLYAGVSPSECSQCPSGEGYTQCFMFDMVDDIQGTSDMLRDILENVGIAKIAGMN